jgi:hypothetical protein
VYRYDGKTIVNFTTKDGLANDTIRQIQEDKFGNIFISTFGGINKFDGKTFTTLQPIKSKEWKLEPNDLWFYILGKKNEGAFRYDGINYIIWSFPNTIFTMKFIHELSIRFLVLTKCIPFIKTEKVQCGLALLFLELVVLMEKQ